jgi:hypothetical protein
MLRYPRHNHRRFIRIYQYRICIIRTGLAFSLCAPTMRNRIKSHIRASAEGNLRKSNTYGQSGLPRGRPETQGRSPLEIQCANMNFDSRRTPPGVRGGSETWQCRHVCKQETGTVYGRACDGTLPDYLH